MAATTAEVNGCSARSAGKPIAWKTKEAWSVVIEGIRAAWLGSSFEPGQQPHGVVTIDGPQVARAEHADLGQRLRVCSARTSRREIGPEQHLRRVDQLEQ